MHCRIYKLDFQEIRGSNPGPGSNFSLENRINKLLLEKDQLH